MCSSRRTFPQKMWKRLCFRTKEFVKVIVISKLLAFCTLRVQSDVSVGLHSRNRSVFDWRKNIRIILVCLAAGMVVASGCTARERDLSGDGRQTVEYRPASEGLTEDHGDVERININAASVEQLERIPHIGNAMARRIIEHRERFGPFRKTEHLIIMDGISDERFRRIRHLITTE